MPKTSTSDWSASASVLLETAPATWTAPLLLFEGRDLPDADLDALAEAMLAGLRDDIDGTKRKDHPSP